MEERRSFWKIFLDLRAIVMALSSIVIATIGTLTWVKVQAQDTVKPISADVADSVFTAKIKPFMVQQRKNTDLIDSNYYATQLIKYYMEDELRRKGRENVIEEGQRKVDRRRKMDTTRRDKLGKDRYDPGG